MGNIFEGIIRITEQGQNQNGKLKRLLKELEGFIRMVGFLGGKIKLGLRMVLGNLKEKSNSHCASVDVGKEQHGLEIDLFVDTIPLKTIRGIFHGIKDFLWMTQELKYKLQSKENLNLGNFVNVVVSKEQVLGVII